MSSEAIKKNIRVSRTARYFMSAPITKATRQVWVVLHGYGQHAGFFLQKFEPLFSADKVFVAPEGLNRFYLKGSAGRVGASWMTSEDRLDEIGDYIAYLDQLVVELQLPEGVKLNVLGFSQGVATVARWVGMGQKQAHHIVLYAGVFPPDLDPGFGGEKWKKPRIDVLIGDQDEFYRITDFTPGFAPLQAVNPLVKIHHFVGGHEIFPAALRNVIE